MGELLKQLRRRQKFLRVVIAGVVVFGFVKLHTLCHGNEYILCSDPWSAEGIAELIRMVRPYFAAIFLIAVFVFISKRTARKEIEAEGGFKAFPEQFDGKIVELSGTVQKILPNSAGEQLKRKITDVYRTLTENEDNTNRFSHQRFLLSSDELIAGESILVHHNTEFGKLALHPGTRLQVRGEYIHRVGKRRGWFGLHSTYYGLLHYTHEPKGFIKVDA